MLDSLSKESEFYFKRDELIHPVISGNKWRKLEGYLQLYYEGNYESVLSFGSAHSNYIHSLAYLCFALSIPLKLLIYGFHDLELTPVLKDLKKWNIEYDLIQRNAQKESCEKDSRNILVIPEGAFGEPAGFGIKNLIQELQSDSISTGLLVACGTASTIKYILENTQNVKLISFTPVQSMKNKVTHERLIWIEDGLGIPFAGYSDELMGFINEFFNSYQIILDPIYTSRLLYSFFTFGFSQIEITKFIFIHSGGLQAWRSYLLRYPQSKKILGTYFQSQVFERLDN